MWFLIFNEYLRVKNCFFRIQLLFFRFQIILAWNSCWLQFIFICMYDIQLNYYNTIIYLYYICFIILSLFIISGLTLAVIIKQIINIISHFPQNSPRSDQTPVPSTVISTSSSAASTPETDRKSLAPQHLPVVNMRKDSQIRRPIPVRPPSVDNIPYQNNHTSVGK